MTLKDLPLQNVKQVWKCSHSAVFYRLIILHFNFIIYDVLLVTNLTYG